MTSARGTYAQRYVHPTRGVCLVHPRRPMTPAQWQEWVAGFDAMGQALHTAWHGLTEALEREGWPGRLVTPSPELPSPRRSVHIIMRPHS